ncbi:hypothetical protein F4778DRAFT_770988 [Xylariomycetidae sp. FL2044]|nr:hypothetical protein F4778DRAFT_770988 [Xylariomycetidae sp. FL2044]
MVPSRDRPRGTVEPDSGRRYIVQNAARLPESPLEPLFRALYLADPSFDVHYCWLPSIRARTGPRTTPFVINVEATGDTLIFSRKYELTREFIQTGRAWWCRVSRISNSTGYQRIISYRLGGLGFLVRHELGGFQNQHRLIIREEGHKVPTGSTLEIKTQVHHRWVHRLPSRTRALWISQTPKLAPQVEAVTAETLAWLIKKILGVVRGYGGNATIRYDGSKMGYLGIAQVGAMRTLPEDFYAKWGERWCN